MRTDRRLALGRAGRRSNLLLLAVLTLALGTGTLAYAIGTGAGRWVVIGHAAAGLAVVLLSPWKSIVVRRSARRHGVPPLESVLLAIAVIVTLGAGVAHSTVGLRGGPVTALQVHVGAALVAVPLLLMHLLTRRQGPRRQDLSRRTALRIGALAGGALLLRTAIEGLATLAALPGRDRRFTGSYAEGEPGQMPVTQWFTDPVPAVDGESYRLRVRAGGQDSGRAAAVGRPRLPAAAGRPRAPGLLVGEVGRADRGRRRAVVVAAAVPAAIAPSPPPGATRGRATRGRSTRRAGPTR